MSNIFKAMMLVVLFCTTNLWGQNAPEANYDESKMPAFTLPDVLTTVDGKKIKTSKAWEANRAKLVQLLAENVYGTTPKLNNKATYKIISVKNDALGGKAIRKLISISFDAYPTQTPIEMMLYLPKNVKKPAVFVGLNFMGNHSITPENDLPITNNWMPDVFREPKTVVNNRATEETRGIRIHRWQIETVVARGYAIATAYYGDIEPDHPDGHKTSIRGIVGQPKTNTWGAISAWAWGYSRMLDYLETDSDVDAKKAIAIGHSRIGKAAVWAAAQDQRFAAVLSNNSGEGGVALMRRWYGETNEIINIKFPHWFSEKFKTYNQNIQSLPTDQHQLVALIAPRPIYVASAIDDRWADPNGEFLGAKNAEPVYALYGKKGLGVATQPAVDTPVGAQIRYHVRTGKHDVTAYDWVQYLKFADQCVR
jgi:hypothetical protein